MPNSKLIGKIKTIPHSRIPVCDGSLDNVVGVLPIRNYLRAYIKDKNVNMRTVMLKPHFVRCTDNIDDLLDSMRQHKIYLGIVRDENNRVCGIVTIEDFLEAVSYTHLDVYKRQAQTVAHRGDTEYLAASIP